MEPVPLAPLVTPVQLDLGLETPDPLAQLGRQDRWVSDQLVPTALQVRLDPLGPPETRVPPAPPVPREQHLDRPAPLENRRLVQQVPPETRVPPATMVPLGPLAQPVPPVQLEIQLTATRALLEEARLDLSATRARPATLAPLVSMI